MIHICTKRDTRWKQLPKTTYIATQYPRPEGLEFNRWIQNIAPQWYPTSQALAEAIAGGLRSPNGPAYVMIDELKASNIDKIAEAARLLKKETDIQKRWGAYIVNGTAVSYSRLNPAIDRLLEANAILCCEMYFKMSLYKKLGKSYLTQNMWGTKSRAKLKWLVARKRYKKSNSHIVGLIGLTPTYLDLPRGSGDFIREMMRTWEQIIPEKLGGWKWDLGSAVGVAPQWPGWNSSAKL